MRLVCLLGSLVIYYITNCIRKCIVYCVTMATNWYTLILYMYLTDWWAISYLYCYITRLFWLRDQSVSNFSGHSKLSHPSPIYLETLQAIMFINIEFLRKQRFGGTTGWAPPSDISFTNSSRYTYRVITKHKRRPKTTKRAHNRLHVNLNQHN